MLEYRKKYIRIYIWQAISMVMGFASLFIVVPHLSSNKTIYGIYSVCTSLTIFFTYADLGFLSSGIKYAAEYYIKGDYKNEIKVIGFTAFFMMTTFMIIDIGVITIGIKPTILIPELLPDSNNYRIAQYLIFTLAIGCPLMIAQRILQVIFTIRVEDYKFQRITIVGYGIRILSVFLFFSSGRYMIIEYYIFYQLVGVLVIFTALFDIRKYGYNIKDFFKSFRFDKSVFAKEKSLSFASLLFMIAMILYNELDQIAISNFFGIESVAIYSTAFSFMTFVRSYSSLVYSPYTSRYNHYVGLKDFSGLIEFTKKMVLIFSPILILPIFNVALYSKPLIISWVGDKYIDSAFMMSWLVMSYALNGITQPLTCYMTSCEKTQKIATGAIVLPIIYWFGIVFLKNFIGVSSFAIMKFFAPALLLFYYWTMVKRDIKSQGYEFLSFLRIITRIIPSILLTVLISFVIGPLMRLSHDNLSLGINILYLSVSVIISLTIAVVFNSNLRKIVGTYAKNKVYKFNI